MDKEISGGLSRFPNGGAAAGTYVAEDRAWNRGT